MDTLTPKQFLGMIKSGAIHVVAHEQELNQLNVFPIADKDTGTNLASMMGYLVKIVPISATWESLFTELTQACLFSGCGNSGLIFSQYFYGLSQVNVAGNELSSESLAEMFQKGAKAALLAVSEPKSGTILTVMQVCADTALANQHLTDVIALLAICLDASQRALAETPKQLAILDRYDVVDAGAQGFVYFVQGMRDFLISDPAIQEKLLAETTVATSHVAPEMHAFTEVPNKQFCFETIISLKDKSLSDLAIKQSLASYGDSIVIAHAQNMVRIHLHTDRPMQVTETLIKLGSIVYQKLDDMKMQYHLSQQQNMPLALVTDSMADVPAEWLHGLGIYVLPIQVKIDGHSFLDKQTISTDQAVKMLSDPKIVRGTAAPAAQSISRLLHMLVQQHPHIIVLTIARTLSSTYDAIINQARMLNEPSLQVVDSSRNSVSQGLLLLYAAQLRAQREGAEQIVAKLEQAKAQVKQLIAIDSLSTLVQSGRVSRFAGFLGKIAMLKPIISIDLDGKPKIAAIAFSAKGNRKKLVKLLKKAQSTQTIKTIAIAHSNASAASEEVANACQQAINLKPLYVSECSSTALVHVGPGSIAVAYTALAIDEPKTLQSTPPLSN